MKTIHIIFRFLKYSNRTFLIISLICLFISCEKFVDVKLPDSQLTGETVFKDKNTANAAMVAVYTKLRTAGVLAGSISGMNCELGIYTDELNWYRDFPTNYFLSNSLFSAEPKIQDIWNKSYSQIYAANAIIEGIMQSSSIAVADKHQLLGEALFVRALVHFYLVNLYGDIPYISTTDYKINKAVFKKPVSEVYSHIVADLTEAISLLPNEYLTDDRVRPNKATAYALLARVYLYMGLWAEADRTSSLVLNNPLYIWETNLNKIFLKESTTTIWQFSQDAGTNTAEGRLFIFTAGPPTTFAISQNLYNAFTNNDQRKSNWIRGITKGTQTWYHSFKYKQRSSTASSVEYSIIFRLAEQYLIRAEARSNLNDLLGAKADLNKIRGNAGLPDTDASTKEAMLEAILKERRLELFTEFGHRFFDLKRTGNLDKELSSLKPGWNSTDALWPLPAQELSTNPNLNPQNIGY